MLDLNPAYGGDRLNSMRRHSFNGSIGCDLPPGRSLSLM